MRWNKHKVRKSDPQLNGLKTDRRTSGRLQCHSHNPVWAPGLSEHYGIYVSHPLTHNFWNILVSGPLSVCHSYQQHRGHWQPTVWTGVCNWKSAAIAASHYWCVRQPKIQAAGALRIQGLWRIYPHRQEARDKLLLECMTLCRYSPKTGSSYKTKTGRNQLQKLWVGNVPLSVDDNVIETALKNLGCEMRSTVRKELAWDNNGKLTNWETGRQFVFISISPFPQHHFQRFVQ